MTFSKRGIVQEDEKVGMLMKSDKKSKKKNAAPNDSEVTKGDVKAIEHDLCSKEEKLSCKGTRKEKDKAKMEIKAPGESEDSDIKRKKERGCAKQPGKLSKDGCGDAVKKKLKNEQETLIMHAASLDTKTIAHESATKTQETIAVEMLSKGSGGNLPGARKKEDGQVDIVAGVIRGDVSADEVKRKKRKKDKAKKEDGQVDITAGVIQGDVSAIDEVRRKKRKKDKKKRTDKLDIEDGVIQGNVSAIDELSPPINDPSEEKHENNEDKLLFGKNFTREEDEIVKDAVYRYIEVYSLGDEGLQKVLKCKSNPELRGCWREIGKAIPYRPYRAVYSRAQRLFSSGKLRKWTEEEYEMVRKFRGEHGHNWTVLADELGKHPVHIGNAWQRIKLENRKRGQWDQEEIQKLFDLVNTDLQLRLSEEKKSKHGMLRDNIWLECN
ncbi:hypothetical protein HAX54_006545 [Datura stramonium]|uniref:Myb-like domain-containing protein n=1 Tax=Datura stramonium TaxID=4076 RepID=A0ABS8RXY6_DATST|nr:hypothetical protein [Datura stramonium]